MRLAGPPGQDEGAGMPGHDPVGIGVERPDFTIDAAFTQAAGDELGDLAAEIQDQNPFVVLRPGERDDIRLESAAVSKVFHGVFQHSRGRRASGRKSAGNPHRPPSTMLKRASIRNRVRSIRGANEYAAWKFVGRRHPSFRLHRCLWRASDSGAYQEIWLG